MRKIDHLYDLEGILKGEEMSLVFFYHMILPIHKFFPDFGQIYLANREFPSGRAARNLCAQSGGYDLMAEAVADNANTVLG